MSQQIPILEILETSAAQIRGLQREIEQLKMMTLHQTIRIAMSQMQGNRIEYNGACESIEWEFVAKGVEAGRIAMDNRGEVYLDRKFLTRELLTQAIAADGFTV